MMALVLCGGMLLIAASLVLTLLALVSGGVVTGDVMAFSAYPAASPKYT